MLKTCLLLRFLATVAQAIVLSHSWFFPLGQSAIFCNTAELSSFSLKRVFGVYKNHPLNIIRLLIHAFMSYSVITNYRKYLRSSITAGQLPLQFWGYLVIVMLEFATVVKHGHLFTVEILPNMVSWLSMLCIGSVIYSTVACVTHYFVAHSEDFTKNGHLKES